VEYLVDINPHKWGKFLPGTGHAVVSPENMREYRPQTVIAMNPVYTDEIRQRLAGMGVTADVIAV
jgi:C-methyltransferase-like protein